MVGTNGICFAWTALILLASLVSATPSLSLDLSSPEEVTDVSNLKVFTTLTNTGDETLKLLNDPRTPLSTLPAHTFTFSNQAGKNPGFNGMMVKYVPEVVAKSGSEESFTVLEPGQSVKVEHNLATVYNFTQAGEGKYKLTSRNLFHYVDAGNHAVPIYAKTFDRSTSIRGKLVIASLSLRRRFSFKNCTKIQQASIRTAASGAANYSQTAAKYLGSLTDNSPRYSTWFGQFNGDRLSTVREHFNRLEGTPGFQSFNFDCSCTENDIYAYVYPEQFGTVYLCGAFWKAPSTGTDSKAGTLVHEASHFIRMGGTRDYVYGQRACRQLAIDNPDQAVMNADSHEYFVENSPPLS